MSVILESSNVIWEFKGIDDGYNFENNIYKEYNFIYSISFLKYEVGLNLGKNNLSKLKGIIEINYNL